MKKSIYVTGIAGSGKTTLTKTLNSLGYEAHDIEDYSYQMFKRIRVDTGEPFLDYDKHDPEKLKNSLKIFDLDRLKELLSEQKADVAFYFGVSNDNEKAMPLFSKSILLQAEPEILNKRLLAREGTNAFANTKATRDLILGWKNEYEDAMIKAGMVVVNAGLEPNEVAENILKLVK